MFKVVLLQLGLRRPVCSIGLRCFLCPYGEESIAVGQGQIDVSLWLFQDEVLRE